MSYPMELHAVYANTVSRQGDRATFRVGLPVRLGEAGDRWQRLDDLRGGWNGAIQRAIRISWMGRTYRVESFEVRTVDRNGRGLGSDRHALAFPIPYRLVRKGR